MNTLTDMIAALRFRLGNKKGIDADILREIQFAQTRLQEDPTIEYWFLLNLSTIVLPEGQAEIPFPDGFIRESEGNLPYIDLGTSFPELEKMTMSHARNCFGAGVGMPRAYSLGDNVLQVYPIPDKQYNLRFSYIRQEPVLTTDPVMGTNAWTTEAMQMLLNKAGIPLAQALRDKDALAAFTNDFNVAFAEMMTRVVQREEANFDHQRGGHDDALRNRNR
jgi:hypothetical protein